jgi:chromosome segregation ATPase
LRAAAEESAARCEEAEARAGALGDEFGGRLAELRDALSREAASAAAAEEARAASSEDRAKLKHAARQAEEAREGLAKRLGLELSRTKRLEAKVATLEEEMAQKSAVELEREALKGKLRSATVSSKELGKELTMLRHKHEATVGRIYTHAYMYLHTQTICFLSVCARVCLFLGIKKEGNGSGGKEWGRERVK